MRFCYPDRVQLPFFYERYAEYFGIITEKAIEASPPDKKAKRKTRTKVEKKEKESSFSFWGVFIIIFILIKLVAMCSRM